MARCLNFLNISLIVLCTSLFLCSDFSFACVIQDDERTLNLSTLDWPSWPAVNKNGSDIVKYDISICKPLNFAGPASACADSSVCRHVNETFTEMGKFMPTSNITVLKSALASNGFTLLLSGSECAADSATNYSAMIFFVCGSTLGAPEVFEESQCAVRFLWKTSAVCSTLKTHQMVPCYAFDDEGNKLSLERLSFSTPTAVVYESQFQNISIAISVCSDIRKDEICKNCSDRTAAYRTMNGQFQSIGELSSGLKLTREGLVLIYELPPSNQTFPGCELPPTTTVIFRCPERLKSQRPRVISDIDCQYEIEWETEHACPEHMLEADFKTCKFTKEVNGIDLDLSPLRKENGGFYEVNATFGLDAPSTLDFNVCGGLGENYECDGSKLPSNAVCLRTRNSSKIIASTTNAKLMLLERHLSLKYEGLECSDGYQQIILFNFYCKPNARNDGVGIPIHIASDKCMHFLFWETKYACLPYKPEIPCSVNSGNMFFDLTRLQKSTGAWTIMAPRRKSSDSHTLYFMNVCGPTIGTMNGNLSRCDGDPAVTRIEHNSKCVNLGEFTDPPVYNPVTQSVRMEYKNGSKCRGNLRWSSIVDFKCYPGLFYSDVILTHVNEVGCVNEFEFRSAISCPSTNVTGSDCKITDSRLGINIDLSSLNSTLYVVRGPMMKFYLSVCSSNDNCSTFLNSSNVAVCSSSLLPSAPVPQDLGVVSTNISYLYGSVSLKYVSSDGNRRTIILFLCNVHGGTGRPLFSRQTRTTTIFHWYTSLVCPQSTPTECVVSDPETGRVYDFSGLSKRDGNWVSYFSERKNNNTLVKRKLYLNICRSLNPAPSCDDLDAGACIVSIEGEKEIKYLSNVGRAIGIPQLQSDDHLQLRYTHGKSCTSFGENTQYSTVVHFICSDSESGGPRYLGKVGECQYSFLWSTKAACPSEIISVENECSLTDPETGFTFDLSSLNADNSYNVSTEEQTYKLNICNTVATDCTGNSSKTDISACEVSKDGQITVLGTTTNFTLQYIRGSDLILTYQNNTSDSKADTSSGVVITLPCDRDASKPQPRFIEQKDQRYFFELRTPLTCIQKVADCNIRDPQGNDYDLTSLFMSTRNWEVPDHRLGHSGAVYYINFCRPLIKVPNYKCPGGATGACLTNSKTYQDVGFSLGSQFSVPIVSRDGTIVVQFTNGDECRMGLKRSARVNLFCSPTQGKLAFLGETPECEYLFSMNTPAACSLRTAVGKDCVVSDPLFGHTFNLHSLKNKDRNISVVDGEYNYFINVCGKLNGFTGRCENSSACQTKIGDKSFSKSLGLPNADLFYSQGIITLSYDDGSLCHGTYKRKTVIQFTCHHPVPNVEEKPYFISEAEDCTYLFDWPTKLACPPYEVSECTAIDDGANRYDLSDLSLPNDNYYVRNPWSHNQTFVINVCRTVVHSPGSLCPYASASCLLDPSKPDRQERALNIGQVTRPPYFEDGKLMIKYSTGASCEGEHSMSFMETIIEFSCDKEKINSEPEFLGLDVCTYYFQWSTAFACSIPDVSELGGNCHVEDPYTGVEFNFSALRADNPYKVPTINHQYFLNVCGAAKGSPCGEQSGVCQQELSGQKRTWNAGNANSNLQIQNGVLLLNYTGGDPCHNKTYERNTIIQFHCSAGPEQLNFLYESSDCTYYFTWTTELACQSLVHCAVKNESHLFDLTPLTENHHYVAESRLNGDSASYYISVCNALGHVPTHPPCPVGSAVCRSDGTTSVSLGRVSFPPFIDFEGHATIIYTNGSQCESKPSEQYKSRIIFLCDRDSFLGYPVLVRRDDDVCVHIFEWRSNIICPLITPETPKARDCFFYDNRTGTHFDLSGMRKTGSQYEVSGDNGDMFLVNMCEAVSENKCKDSTVCLRNDDESFSSFGTLSSQKFTYVVGNQLRVIYGDGDKCGSSGTGRKSSEIIFSCDPKNGIGKPRIHKKYGCLVVFIWETSLVCRNFPHPCRFSVDKKIFDINLLSSLSHNWETVDSDNMYVMNLCRGLYMDSSAKGCPSNAAVCMKQNNSIMALGLVHTMTKNLTESGELLLTYTSGSTSPCLAVNSSVNPLTAGAKILLKCGTTFGNPQFQSGPDNNCYFNFVWSTSIACEVKNEEMIIESNGTLYDERLDYQMDLSEIMNRTFKVNGNSKGVNYAYIINIGQGYSSTTSSPDPRCSSAAVCQTKSGDSSFYRDIGSISSRSFFIKGTDLHLILTSEAKGCGRDPERNVTTLFTMKCTSYSGDGIPEFMYESGGCDYIFNWDTNAVCPQAHRRDKPDPEIPVPASHDDIPEGQVSKHNSSATAAIIAVLSIIVILCPIVYVVSNKERRTSAAAKIRNVFHRVTLPHFRYRRAGGEMLILINGEQVHQSDFRDDDLLT